MSPLAFTAAVLARVRPAFLAAALALGGCAFDQTVPLADGGAATPPDGAADAPSPGGSSARPLPDDLPRVIGFETRANRDYRRLVAAFGGAYDNPRVAALLKPLIARLGQASDDPNGRYRLTLLNSPAVNAFALPSGDIFVSRGLLALANDTSEIAAVLAHEIAHVTARHAVARAELERRSALVSRVVAQVLQDPVAGQMARDQGRVEIASFSRAQEIEADLLGVRTIARAGFDPFGASRFLTALGRTTSMRDAALGAAMSQPDFLSTHPSTPERIEAATFAARQLTEPSSSRGAKDRDEYLAAIDGMIFGNDPAGGVVEGREFVHPRLGFAFSAPEGFVLDQSAQALLGLKPGGAEALRFDGVRLDPEDTLEGYLARGLIEGAETSEVQAISINGLRGATGIARGRDWTFRFGVIQLGDTVYRLILAAKSFTPATDERFLSTITSFRPLSAAESARVRGLRIRILAARPGDTPETLGQRMAVGGAVAFRVLNNLDPSMGVEPGRRYKILAR